jgi:hypothetical protein
VIEDAAVVDVVLQQGPLVGVLVGIVWLFLSGKIYTQWQVAALETQRDKAQAEAREAQAAYITLMRDLLSKTEPARDKTTP